MQSRICSISLIREDSKESVKPEEEYEEEDNSKFERLEQVSKKRSIGCQTLFRESETQTHPAALGEIERDNNFLEILELSNLSYGNGLPATMEEIEMIVKAREKRVFNDALPPLSDEVTC